MSHSIERLLHERILVLDGGMGTMIQNLIFSIPFQTCYDQFCLTRPEVIRSIHRQYLEAGADIITTNSFQANALSLAGYGLSDQSVVINQAAAQLAREEANRWLSVHPDSPVFVAGSLGPTPREATPSAIFEAYKSQIQALLQGGVDYLLFETVVSSTALQIGLKAALAVFAEQGCSVPISVSAAITPAGLLYSGETLEQFVAATADVSLLSLGLNCSCGGEGCLRFMQQLSGLSTAFLSLCPNASDVSGGSNLPDAMGVTLFCEWFQPFLEVGLLRIVGGCCGVRPLDIKGLKGSLDSKGGYFLL